MKVFVRMSDAFSSVLTYLTSARRLANTSCAQKWRSSMWRSLPRPWRETAEMQAVESQSTWMRMDRPSTSCISVCTKRPSDSAALSANNSLSAEDLATNDCATNLTEVAGRAAALKV